VLLEYRISTSEKFYLVPEDTSIDEALEIDRLNFDLRLISESLLFFRCTKYYNSMQPKERSNSMDMK